MLWLLQVINRHETRLLRRVFNVYSSEQATSTIKPVNYDHKSLRTGKERSQVVSIARFGSMQNTWRTEIACPYFSGGCKDKFDCGMSKMENVNLHAGAVYGETVLIRAVLGYQRSKRELSDNERPHR